MVPVPRQLSRRLLLIAVVAHCAPLAAAAATDRSEALPTGPRLVWSDPQGLVPFGLQGVGEQLAMMGGVMGVDMRLVPESPAADHGEHTYRAALMRRPKSYWHLREDVMAAAPRVEGSQGTIYVFVDQVRHVLGHLASQEPSDSAREYDELSTALARILAHEVVHLVAPDHPHASAGLMVAKMRRSLLLKRQPRFDPVCARAFRRALGAHEPAAASGSSR